MTYYFQSMRYDTPLAGGYVRGRMFFVLFFIKFSDISTPIIESILETWANLCRILAGQTSFLATNLKLFYSPTKAKNTKKIEGFYFLLQNLVSFCLFDHKCFEKNVFSLKCVIKNWLNCSTKFKNKNKNLLFFCPFFRVVNKIGSISLRPPRLGHHFFSTT